MLPKEGDVVHIKVGGDMDNPLMAIFNVLKVDPHRDIYFMQLMEVKLIKKED